MADICADLRRIEGVVASVLDQAQMVDSLVRQIVAQKAQTDEERWLLDLLFSAWRHSVLLGQLVSEEIAFAHLNELAKRMLADEDLRPPTNAEMLWVVSEITQNTPVKPAVSNMFRWLFAQVYDEYHHMGDGVEIGYLEQEVLGDLLRRLRQPKRTLEAIVRDALHLAVLTDKQRRYYETLLR